MASTKQPTTVENLPGEVLSDIFIRLLAKQLAQMRCVCKPWNALLSESSFIKSHDLHRSIHKNDDVLLSFPLIFSFDYGSFTARPSRSPSLELINLIKLPVNPQFKHCKGTIIGSVNGLICFYHRTCHNNVVGIWNPSLSAVLTIPPSSFSSRNSSSVIFGFGFDPETDDYKVVKLTCVLRPPNMVAQAEVYSMRKGSWELVSQRFPLHIRISDKNGVCVDGHANHLHWLGYTVLEWKPETIVAFDLGAETFSEIPLPHSIKVYNVKQRFNVLGVLAGKLCVMSCVVEGGKCDVWVMGEYGVTESWVKHHAFSHFNDHIIPYGFTSHKEFLFKVNEYNNYFSLYDPVASKTKTFKNMSKKYIISKVVEYMDGLVWIEPDNRLQI